MFFIREFVRKIRQIGLNCLIHYGPVQTWGYGFRASYEGSREPGMKDTELTLRVVRRTEISNEPELQMRLEIVQHYRSGANSRRMSGSICLHGEALAAFRELVNMNATPTDEYWRSIRKTTQQERAADEGKAR